MYYWFCKLVMIILIPATMIIVGNIYAKKAPKKINGVFGYRTAMSMKNMDTWEYAHHYCGKLWRVVGLVLLLFSFTVMGFVFGRDTRDVSDLSSVITVVQVIVSIVSIIPTEVALRKAFDADGNRK